MLSAIAYFRKTGLCSQSCSYVLTLFVNAGFCHSFKIIANQEAIVIAIFSPATNKRKWNIYPPFVILRGIASPVLVAYFLPGKVIFSTTDLYEHSKIDDGLKWSINFLTGWHSCLTLYTVAFMKFKTFSCSNVLIVPVFFCIFWLFVRRGS